MNNENQPVSQPNQPVIAPQTSQKTKLPVIITGAVFLLGIGFAGGYFFFMTNQPDTKKDSPKNTQLSPTPSATPTLTPGTKQVSPVNWESYHNADMGISLKYPPNMYVSETENTTMFTFAVEPLEGWGPGPVDMFQLSNRSASAEKEFFDLLNANPGEDVPSAHHAVNVRVTKIADVKIGTYQAVEFIHDGITAPKTSDLGRGPIGYSHKLLIKKSASEFIEFSNTSMKPEKTKQQDIIFKDILLSLAIE